MISMVPPSLIVALGLLSFVPTSEGFWRRGEARPRPPLHVTEENGVYLEWDFRAGRLLGPRFGTDCYPCAPPGVCVESTPFSEFCILPCAADSECPEGTGCTCLNREKCSASSIFAPRASSYISACGFLRPALHPDSNCARLPVYKIRRVQGWPSLTLVEERCDSPEKYSIYANIMITNLRFGTIFQVESTPQDLEKSYPIAHWKNPVTLIVCLPEGTITYQLEEFSGVTIQYACACE